MNPRVHIHPKALVKARETEEHRARDHGAILYQHQILLGHRQTRTSCFLMAIYSGFSH